MFRTNRRVWAGIVFTVLAAGVVGLGQMASAFAVSSSDEKAAVLHQQDIKKVQETLRDKGFYAGEIDGLIGSQTREGIRKYQKSENLAVNGRLDAETAAKFGVPEESVGGNFKNAGREVGKGGAEVGHEMKKGKPLAAGKEMGKALGRAGQEVGSGVKKAVSTESDRGEREKKP